MTNDDEEYEEEACDDSSGASAERLSRRTTSTTLTRPYELVDLDNEELLNRANGEISVLSSESSSDCNGNTSAEEGQPTGNETVNNLLPRNDEAHNSSTSGVSSRPRVAEQDSHSGFGPDYKDQVVEKRKEQKQQETETTASPGGSIVEACVPIVEARVLSAIAVTVDGGETPAIASSSNNNSSDGVIYPAEGEALKGTFIVINRKIVLCAIGVLFLVAVAAVVGGLCGTGKCAQEAPRTNSSGKQPPTLAPTLDAEGLATLNFINSIKVDSNNSIVAPKPWELEEATPEQMAVQWLIDNKPYDLKSEEDRVKQLYSLLTIYFGMGGDSWSNHANWLNSNVTECDWFGIECSREAPDAVTSVVLWRNELRGIIPPDIALLESLTSLDLSSNPSLVGPLPTEIGRLEQLQEFQVDSCRLSGTLPASIVSWTNLTKFHINENFFTSSLPDAVGNWTSLRSFQVSFNLFNSTLPDFIGNWADIEVFAVEGNAFDSELPSTIGEWLV